jgi:PAS domain S-box-containing protein/putative nucleotidyltransferase with HDIG domain
MRSTIRILHLEDTPVDAELIREKLCAEGITCEIHHVSNRAEYLTALDQGGFDLILADYSLPEFDGSTALQMAKEKYPEIPTIIVTGSLGEEKAVEILKQGAIDYVLKHQLERLPPAVTRAIREAEEHTQRKQAERALAESEEKYRNLVENALTGVYQTDINGKILYANEALVNIFEFSSVQELIGTSVIDRYKNLNDRARLLADLQKNRKVTNFEVELLTKTGKTISALLSATLIDHILSGMILDITERKRAEEQLNQQFNRINALRTIDLAITSSLDLRVTLNVILDQVTSQLQIDASSILLMNPHAHILEFVAARGFRTTALKYTKLRFGEGYAGRAAQERRIVFISNLQDEKNTFKSSPLLTKEEFISYYGVPLLAKGQVKGVLEVFHRKLIEPEQDWLDFLDALAGQAAIAIDNASLFNDLQKSNIDLVLAYDSTLEGWSAALDLRDHDTEGHTLRVTDLTLQLARNLGMSEQELVHARRGALLHDIGKMGIPDAILNKPGKLSDEEWVIMKKHSVYAYEWLSPIVYLRPALDIPYGHHEKWDGTGYPRGFKEEQIPLAARIFAVIDVWDALISNRPYRSAWSQEKALAHIQEQAGKHFDPKVVDAFLKMPKKI